MKFLKVVLLGLSLFLGINGFAAESADSYSIKLSGINIEACALRIKLTETGADIRAKLAAKLGVEESRLQLCYEVWGDPNDFSHAFYRVFDERDRFFRDAPVLKKGGSWNLDYLFARVLDVSPVHASPLTFKVPL